MSVVDAESSEMVEPGGDVDVSLSNSEMANMQEVAASLAIDLTDGAGADGLASPTVDPDHPISRLNEMAARAEVLREGLAQASTNRFEAEDLYAAEVETADGGLLWYVNLASVSEPDWVVLDGPSTKVSLDFRGLDQWSWHLASDDAAVGAAPDLQLDMWQRVANAGGETFGSVVAQFGNQADFFAHVGARGELDALETAYKKARREFDGFGRLFDDPTDNDLDDDDNDVWLRDTPNGLIPKMGELPVSSAAYYQSLVITEAPGTGNEQFTGPLDTRVNPFVDASVTEMHRPTIGVLLTFEQAWFQRGLALGELRKSLCLAPGEVTQVAVTDWRRSTRSRDDSEASQVEQLAAQTRDASAAVSIQQSALKESRSGSSFSMGGGSHSQAGASFGIPLLGSASSSTSTNTSFGIGAASSAGRRDVAATSAKNIQRRTQQLAQSARSARATQVREVEESETQSTQTRVVANYNHSHAMTMQYYEVVQIYGLRTRAVRGDRCVFVPLKPFMFDEESMLLTPDATLELLREVLQASGNHDVDKQVQEFQIERPKLQVEAFQKLAAEKASLQAKLAEQAKVRFEARNIHAVDAQNPSGSITRFVNNGTTAAPNWIREDPGGGRVPMAVRGQGYDQWSWYLTDTTNQAEFMVDMWRRRVKRSSADIATIAAQFDRPRAAEPELELPLAVDAYTTPLALDVYDAMKRRLAAAAAEYNRRSVVLEQFRELFGILADSALAINQQMWMLTDSHVWRSLLAGRTYPDGPYAGHDIGGLVDPAPVGFFGNYLAFKWDFPSDRPGETYYADQAAAFEATFVPASDEALAAGSQPSFARDREDATIAIPTEGIFAEAVLGESNSSEKIDMTRFWNWQESPIPILPPEISAVSTESRARSVEAPARLRLAQALVELRSQGIDKDLVGTGAILDILNESIDKGDSIALLQDAVMASTTASGLASEGAGSAGQASVDISKIMGDFVVDMANSELAKIATEAAMAYATGGATKFGGLANLAKKSGAKAKRSSTKRKRGDVGASSGSGGARGGTAAKQTNGTGTSSNLSGGTGSRGATPGGSPSASTGTRTGDTRGGDSGSPSLRTTGSGTTTSGIGTTGSTDPDGTGPDGGGAELPVEPAPATPSTPKAIAATIGADGLLDAAPATGVLPVPLGREHTGRDVTAYQSGAELKIVDRQGGAVLGQFVVFGSTAEGEQRPSSALVIDAGSETTMLFDGSSRWRPLPDSGDSTAAGIADFVTDPAPPTQLTVDDDADVWLPLRGGWVPVRLADSHAGAVVQLDVEGSQYRLYESAGDDAPIAVYRVFLAVVNIDGTLDVSFGDRQGRYESSAIVASQVVLVVIDELWEFLEIFDGETTSWLIGASLEAPSNERQTNLQGER